MKIALVDDEQKCLDEMIRLCSDFGRDCGYPIETFSFASGEAFLAAFENGGFSIVFMDIYMEGINGVTAALNMRRQDSGCILVFLTSSKEFMPDAFSCHAFEYVTKPFSPQRIFEVLADAVKVLPQSQKHIALANGRTTVQVSLDEIASIVTDAHYLEITLADSNTLRCRMTITEFTELTGHDPRFISVNKGITVNAEYILDFEDNCCVLENGTRFPVRVRGRLKIEQTARDYNFRKIREQQTHSAGYLDARRHRRED